MPMQHKTQIAYPSWLQYDPRIGAFQNSRWKSWILPIFPVWEAVYKTARLSSLPLQHSIRHPCPEITSYNEGRDAADVPGYCSSRTGRRAAGYRRFIQRDARVLVPFPHRSCASMTVETDVTAIYRQVRILNEQFVLSSCLKWNTHSYKSIDKPEPTICLYVTLHRMWQTFHRIGKHRGHVALQIAV